MTKKDYLSERQEKKRATARGIVGLVVFIIIFIGVIIRIAVRPGINAGALSSLPAGDEAFEIAKDFVKPTWKSGDSKFPDNEYEFVKNSDSVYVVTSYFDTKNNFGTAIKTNYTATLKYNGGAGSNQQNWTLVKLEEH